MGSQYSTLPDIYDSYRRRGKISWAKYLWFHPYEVFLWKYFHGALVTSVYYLPIAKNSWENFCGKLKNHENHESLAQRIFPVYSILSPW